MPFRTKLELYYHSNSMIWIGIFGLWFIITLVHWFSRDRHCYHHSSKLFSLKRFKAYMHTLGELNPTLSLLFLLMVWGLLTCRISSACLEGLLQTGFTYLDSLLYKTCDVYTMGNLLVPENVLNVPTSTSYAYHWNAMFCCSQTRILHILQGLHQIPPIS